MEVKGKELTRADILKIIFNKFLRLAPCYYICWVLVAILSPRIISGPVSYNSSEKNMYGCKENWIYVATMTSNLFGTAMDVPFEGCYQQAWAI